MNGLTVYLEPIAYRLAEVPWLGDLRPYEYQRRVLERVRQALDRRETLALFLTAPTGSGKTLAAYAVPILSADIRALGVYPTNELIKDQERALRPWLAPRGEHALLRIDGRALDRWAATLNRSRHGPTLETLLSWEPVLLTNPDILFYLYFGLYGGEEADELNALRQRLFVQVGRYQVFVFDEFHLYNAKQMADVAFLVGTLQAIQPGYGRVFIFSSATPDILFRPMLEKLGLPLEVIPGEAVPEGPDTRRVAHPLRLTLLPANLGAWEGPERLQDFLPAVEEFLKQYPAARMVAILDSVAGAIRLAEALRERFPDRPVGEVHGFSSEQEREEALLRPITVGTSTIEVGVDFVDDRAKELLLFEARTSGQFIQRLGRIARHEEKSGVPFWAVALVPEYVYNFLAGQLTEGQSCSRAELYRLVEEAYAPPEDFASYVRRHAPAVFCAARARVLDRLFMSDDGPRVREALAGVGEALTGAPEGRGWALYHRYREEQILAPLLTFRGSGLEVAVVDERGTDPGFPVRRYDLIFLLRRGDFTEISPEEFEGILNKLEPQWPEEVAVERRYARLIGTGPEDLLGVYGYFRLRGLLDRPRRVWFELPEEAVEGRVGEVFVVEGLEVQTEPAVRLRRLNRLLCRKRIVAWVMDRHPKAVRLGRALPPLFEVHELRVRRVGGGLGDAWSIAFNQNAFLVESLGGWGWGRRAGAIVL